MKASATKEAKLWKLVFEILQKQQQQQQRQHDENLCILNYSIYSIFHASVCSSSTSDCNFVALMCVCVSNFLFKNVHTQNRVEFNKSCMGESSSSSNSNQLRNNVITSLYHQHKLVQNILWDLNMRYEWSDDALTNKSIIINRCWKLIRFFSLFFSFI